MPNPSRLIGVAFNPNADPFLFLTSGATAMPETLEAPETQTLADAQVPASQGSAISDVQSGDGGSRADVQSGIDEGLASLARDYGFDPEEWKANPAALEKAVTQFDRLYSHHSRMLSQPQTQPNYAPADGTNATERKRLELAMRALDSDDIDPSIVGFSKQTTEALQQMNDYYQSQIDGFSPLQEKLASMERYIQDQENLRFEQQLDDSFDRLGDEFKELYGKGPMHELRPTSLQSVNRQAVAQALFEIRYMDAQSGRRVPFASQFKRAQHLANGEQLPTIERRRLALQAHSNKSAALSRPAGKNGTPLASEEAVLSRIREWQSRVDS